MPTPPTATSTTIDKASSAAPPSTGSTRTSSASSFAADQRLAGVATRESRPVSADEYDELPPRIPNDAYHGFASAIVGQMTWAGETRGVLGVATRDESRRFDESNVELLETFAGPRGATALRNAESFEQRTSQARIQRGLYRIASALAEHISHSATLNAVAHAANEALGAKATALLTPSPRGSTLTGAHELPATLNEEIRDGLPDGPRDDAATAADRRVPSSRELTDDDRFGDEWRDRLAGAGISALLAIPVDQPHHEDAAGLVLVVLRSTSARCATRTSSWRATSPVLRVARSSEAACSKGNGRARALAQQLARTGSALATELDPAAVLDEVVQRAPELLGADACAIRIVDGDELLVTAVAGSDAEGRARSSQRDGGVALGRGRAVAQGGRGRLMSRRRGLLASDAMLAAGYSAYLGVPLVGPERLPPRRDRRVRARATALAPGRDRSVARARGEHRDRPLERGALPARRTGEGAQHGHPREHRRRDRRVDRDGKVVLWNRAAAQ